MSTLMLSREVSMTQSDAEFHNTYGMNAPRVKTEQANRRVIRQASIRSASLVPEGQGMGYIVCKDTDIDETMLNHKEYNIG